MPCIKIVVNVKCQYCQSTITGITPVAQYNGNIASQSWGTTAAPNAKSYVYSYDKLNRLLSGVSTDNNNENGIAYDQMGNITALNRYQLSAEVDQLAYTYTTGTNQLQKVVDNNASNNGMVSGTTNYTWDGNGNMLSAANTTNTQQNKSFTYNLLNLPSVATIPGGTASYTYDANGVKWRKTDVSSGATVYTEYINGIQYYGTAPDTLDFIQTEEGKAAKLGSGVHFDYTYYLGDNLGNTRVTFGTKNGIAQVYQTDDYYPFGLEINSLTTNPKNEYLYNKKELQEEFNEYDYGARFYDPVIARWTSVDPSAENDVSLSPYIYGFDNSVRFTDPDGRWPDGDCCGVVGAFAGGLYNDLKGAVVGTVQAVIHPVNTLTGIAKLGMDPVTQMQAGVAIVNGASEGYQTFKNGDGNVRAAMIGGLVGEGAQLFGGEFAEAAKVGKIGELADKVGEVVKAVNGNSKVSTNAQHIYEIVNNTTGDVEKVGVSGGKISQAGDSYRATGQVNKLKKAGGDYSSRIAEKVPAGPGARGKALEVEKAIADKNRSTLNPDIHQRP